MAGILLFWLFASRPVVRAMGAVMFLWYFAIGMARGRDRDAFLRVWLIWSRAIASLATVGIVVALILRATDS